MCCICSGPLCVYVSLCVAVSLLAPVGGSVCAPICSLWRWQLLRITCPLPTHLHVCPRHSISMLNQDTDLNPTVLRVPLHLSCGRCLSLSAWSCRCHLAVLPNPCPGRTRPGTSPISGLNPGPRNWESWADSEAVSRLLLGMDGPAQSSLQSPQTRPEPCTMRSGSAFPSSSVEIWPQRQQLAQPMGWIPGASWQHSVADAIRSRNYFHRSLEGREAFHSSSFPCGAHNSRNSMGKDGGEGCFHIPRPEPRGRPS